MPKQKNKSHNTMPPKHTDHEPERLDHQPPRGFKTIKDTSWSYRQLLVVVAIFALVGSYLLIHSFAAPLTEEDNSPPPAAVKKVKPVGHHISKAVCGKPAKANQVSCMAHILTDDNGTPLKPTPPKKGSANTSTETSPNAAASGVVGYAPQEIHTAYSLPCTPGGPIQAICPQPDSFSAAPLIAIVDAYGAYGADDIEAQLSVYDQQFGLPACTRANGCLNIVNQSGQTSPLPPDDVAWATETLLDLDAVHMTCQTCRMVLVEASSNSFSDLAAAENTAATFHPVAISNSYGGAESGFAVPYDPAFNHPGIAIVAASGDFGGQRGENEWPGIINTVVSVGGTKLKVNTDNSWAGESYWSHYVTTGDVEYLGGWGCANVSGRFSDFEPPLWQTKLSNWSSVGYQEIYNGTSTFHSCSQFNLHRATADLSADADPDTGILIYHSNSWGVIGGTSLSTPLIASMFALAGGVPAGYSQPAYIPYSQNNGTNFRDITDDSGDPLRCSKYLTVPLPDYTACDYVPSMAGFDLYTGLGSPNGIGGFVANGQPPAPATCPAGTTGTPPNCTAAPDTTLPAVATKLSASIDSSTSASISWQASTDNVAVTGYDVYRGNTKITSVTTNAYVDNALKANSSYSYYVIAFDAAGNRSVKSTALGFKTPALSTTNGSITGRVVDVASGKPLSSVKVYYVLNGRNKSVSTNSSGYYVISGLPPVAYSLTYALSNYTTQSASATTTAANNTNQDINLYHL